MSMYPTVRDPSRLTLRLAVRFRLAKLAPTPAPSGILPKSHLLVSLQFWVPALSPSHTARPLVITVFGAWITGPATDSRVAENVVPVPKPAEARLGEMIDALIEVPFQRFAATSASGVIHE